MLGAPEQYARKRILLLLFLPCLAAAFHSAKAQIPAKSVVDLDGHGVNPFQRAGGKVVVFLFVRTDCPISNRYAPIIQEMSSHFARGAEFFLIYPIHSESSLQVRKHLLEYGYKLTALRDPQLELVKAAQVRVTPEAAVFAADGRLLYHGRIDDWYADIGRARPAPTTHELSSAVEAAITGKTVAIPAMPAVGCFLPDTP